MVEPPLSPILPPLSPILHLPALLPWFVWGLVAQMGLIFVDDLHIPWDNLEAPSAGVEVLRCFLDGKRIGTDVRVSEDAVVVAGMRSTAATGPHDRAHTHHHRCLKHFNVLTIAQPDDDTLTQIFRRMCMMAYFPPSQRHRFRSLQRGLQDAISATVTVYRRLMDVSVLKSARSVCSFSMHDLHRIFKGVRPTFRRHGLGRIPGPL